MQTLSEQIAAILDAMTAEARIAKAFPVVTRINADTKHKVYAFIEGRFCVSMFDERVGVSSVTMVPPAFFENCVLDEPEAG